MKADSCQGAALQIRTAVDQRVTGGSGEWNTASGRASLPMYTAGPIYVLRVVNCAALTKCQPVLGR